MKKVMCFGAFDLFHEGHRYFLSQSAQYGHKLYITVARDISIERIKGNPPLFTQYERLRVVKKEFPNAEVHLGSASDFYDCIRKYKPDILCFGYDQEVNEEKIYELFPHIIIKRIKAHKEDTFKSSILKKNKTKAS